MIGEGINRIDGPLKVTGRAVYSYERRDAGQPLYGYILGASIAKGRISGIDPAAAEAAPGVRLVWTHENAPEQAPFKNKPDLFGRAHPQLTTDVIDYYGKPVAFVVADSFEQARAAAGLIQVGYEVEPGAYDLAANADKAEWIETCTIGPKGETRFGDVDQAMADGPVTVEAGYSTPYHFSHPIELPACLADWQGDHLHVYVTAQMVTQFRGGLANTLKLDRSQITVDSAFVGGGFGSKLFLHAETVLACLATRALAKPVKVLLTRRQIFTLVGHRPEVISRIRLAATPDGRLTAIGHDANMQIFGPEPWSEPVATVARSLYAAPNRLTRHAHTPLDVKTGEAVRAPGELPGLLVFESAMDELAEKLGMDPVELRIRNDTDIDPELDLPLNGRRLADCLREGAKRFGWEQRPRTPASRREGKWLIGYGVASCMRAHFQMPTEVKVRIETEGRVIVESDMTDIGTGTYTIVAQIAAAGLGVPVNQVQVRLARTEFPKSEGSGGSWGASNTSVATDRACQILKEQIGAVAGAGYNDLFAEVRRHFPQGLEASGKTLSSADDPTFSKFSQNTYGAAFAEAAVDADTGEVRLRRMLGVFAAGRIINVKTARSQLIGGMIWGVSAALHEGAHIDPRYGSWVNGDLADYVIPVHADIPDIDAVMLDDYDEHANHLGMKGIGELGACGTGGAVANAVYNACGVRVRDFPITLAKLLPGLRAVA
jgi:xanthine dehydrogenase YagR molybdenum-binding subunit